MAVESKETNSKANSIPGDSKAPILMLPGLTCSLESGVLWVLVVSHLACGEMLIDPQPGTWQAT